MTQIEEVVRVPASKLRWKITDLSRPDPSKVYVVYRHGDPLLLLWPGPDLGDPSSYRVKMTWAIKARNAFSSTEALVPEYPQIWSQTALKRNAIDAYLAMAASPVPGLVSHYGRPVAIYVAVREERDVEIWIATMKKLLE